MRETGLQRPIIGGVAMRNVEGRTPLVIAFVLAVVGAGVAGARQRPAPVAQSDARELVKTEFVIKDVRVFDGDRVIRRTNVLVRDGSIMRVGSAAPAGVESIPGDGRTLLPGFIDAHTHAFGDALRQALVFGVTTELDMFTAWPYAAAMRAEQQAGPVSDRADLYSAGTCVTCPEGHGTEYGMPIPTISGPEEAEEFVAA